MYKLYMEVLKKNRVVVPDIFRNSELLGIPNPVDRDHSMCNHLSYTLTPDPVLVSRLFC